VQCGIFQEGPAATIALASTTGIHSDGSNYGFWDGHVKWLKGGAVSPGANAATPTSPQTTTAGGAGNAAGTQGLFASGKVPAATYSIT